MPRPRQQQSSSSQLSPGQASYVLERLMKERRVSQGDVNRYVSDMGREISDLEERLQRLREAHGGGGAATGGSTSPAAGGGTAGRKRGPGRPRGRRPGRPPASAAQTEEGGAQSQPAAGKARRGGKKRGRRSAVTSDQMASRQLQGRYLALVRRFPEKRRAEYARIAKERGREAAIKEMQSALNK